MAIREGRLLICDRCGRIAFEDLIGEDAHLIKEDGWRYGNLCDDGKTLCPFCNAILRAKGEVYGA